MSKEEVKEHDAALNITSSGFGPAKGRRISLDQGKKSSSHILVTEFNVPIAPFLPEANST